MLDGLFEFIAQLWSADSEIRDRSLTGESEFDRKCRRSVAWLCGGAMVLIALAALAWWWFTSK